MPARSAAVYQSAQNQKEKRKKTATNQSTQQLIDSADALETFKDEEERKKWLQTHDADGSGNFQRSEFLKLLSDLTGSPDLAGLVPGANVSTLVPESLIQKIFGTKDGLDVDEVYAGLKRCIAYLKSQSRLEDMFREVDADNNGFLNEKELIALLQKGAPKGYKVKKSDAEFVILKCDRDRDGRISIAELGPVVACWMEAVKKLPPQQSQSSMCVLL